MPLKKGKSQKTVSLFFEPVRNVFLMLQGMTHWAQNFQIRQIVIFSVSIFVMDAQNFWNRIVTASFAFFNHISMTQVFSYGLKIGVPFCKFRLVNTCSAAINTSFRWASKKFFPTMFTKAGNRTFCCLRLIITCSAAIFGSVRTRRNMGKFSPAASTVSCNLNSRSQTLACSGTILETVESVFGNVNKYFAMPALHIFASKGF